MSDTAVAGDVDPPLRRATADASLWVAGPRKLVVAAVLASLFAVSLPTYPLQELSFVFILAIASIGLTLLSGSAGLISLGQGAFVGVGAYLHAGLVAHGVSLPLSFLMTIASCCATGLVFGVPALRVSGTHFVIMTMACAMLAEHVFGRWSTVTGGYDGLAVPPAALMGHAFDGPRSWFLVTSACLALAIAIAGNLLRTSAGRAWVAGRDAAIAARALGVDLGRSRLAVFATSAGFAGAAGALLAHQLRYLTPDAFGLALSLQLLLAVFIGGAGTVRGAVLGAFVVGLMPTAISFSKPWLPTRLASQPGLELFLQGAILCICVLFEPRGLEGRFAAVALWLERRSQRFDKRTTFLPVTTSSDVPEPMGIAMTGAGPRALEIQGLTFAYGGIHAVQDVNLSLAQGEICALVGPNGAGKTSVLNAVSRVVGLQAGEIQFGHTDLRSVEPHAVVRLGIARTFQNPELVVGATVLDNLLLGCHVQAGSAVLSQAFAFRSARRRESDARATALEVASWLGLSGVSGLRVADLSYGLRKRVELGRALLARPRLLLLDEPAAGLNEQEACELAACIKRVQQFMSLTVLLVEHHLPFVELLAKRIVVMNEGRILAQGAFGDVFSDPKVQELYLDL